VECNGRLSTVTNDGVLTRGQGEFNKQVENDSGNPSHSSLDTLTHLVTFEEAGNIGHTDRYFVLLSRFSTKPYIFG
jgi:hypothetical protein